MNRLSDAFERMAKDAFDKAEQNAWESTCWEDVAAKLLRAQHRKMVRMVTNLADVSKSHKRLLSYEHALGYEIALDDIMAKLDAMAGKGKP